MLPTTWRWIVGMLYVVAVAIIWIVASFVVQSVVDGGVSPFLVTYICNSLFLVYIPLVEVGRLSEPLFSRLWSSCRSTDLPTDNIEAKGSETENLLADGSVKEKRPEDSAEAIVGQASSDDAIANVAGIAENRGTRHDKLHVHGVSTLDDSPRMWTRKEIASVSLLVCPFWFLAQYTFNLSLKFTTVTSNTILSSTSSLFTFLLSLRFLEEKFTWLKLCSVLLCMAGTILVSLSDSEEGASVPTNPAWGDLFCLASAVFYATYTTLIRKNLPDETKGEGRASTALFLGFLGLFNLLLLLPIALILHFTGVEPFHRLTSVQFGLIVGKGLLDNVVSDYLWAKAVLLTSTTAATAGLTIQVPIAAAVDLIRGIKLGVLELIGGIAVLVGFFGINKSAAPFCSSSEDGIDKEGAGLNTAALKETALATS